MRSLSSSTNANSLKRFVRTLNSTIPEYMGISPSLTLCKAGYSGRPHVTQVFHNLREHRPLAHHTIFLLKMETMGTLEVHQPPKSQIELSTTKYSAKKLEWKIQSFIFLLPVPGQIHQLQNIISILFAERRDSGSIDMWRRISLPP